MSNEPTRVGGGSNQSEIATRPPLPPFTRLLPETAVTKPTATQRLSTQGGVSVSEDGLTRFIREALRRSPKRGRPRYTAGPRRRGKAKHSLRGHPVPGP